MCHSISNSRSEAGLRSEIVHIDPFAKPHPKRHQFRIIYMYNPKDSSCVIFIKSGVTHRTPELPVSSIWETRRHGNFYLHVGPQKVLYQGRKPCYNLGLRITTTYYNFYVGPQRPYCTFYLLPQTSLHLPPDTPAVTELIPCNFYKGNQILL